MSFSAEFIETVSKRPAQCRALLAAMIERAILDLKSPDYKVRRAARAWIFAANRGKFSFYWCAENLDLNSEELCKEIRVRSLKLMQEVESRDELYLKTQKRSRNSSKLHANIFQLSA